MPSLPLRIAILECDTPLDGTRAKYGTYGGVFTSLLKAGADALQHPGLTSSSGLDLSTYDVVHAQLYPSLEEIDAVLLTGSRYNSFDDDPWIVNLVEYTKTVLAQDRVRIIGVCFGHQIVGRAMGVKVGRSEGGWETSVTAVDLTKRGQEIFGRSALALHQMHRDAVFSLPPEVESLAYTSSCAVQSMYIPNHLLTVQGHPEFTEEIMRELLETRHKSGIFDDEMFRDSMSRVDKYQDGVVVASTFLQFVLE